MTNTTCCWDNFPGGTDELQYMTLMLSAMFAYEKHGTGCGMIPGGGRRA